MVELITFIILIIIGFTFGRLNERRHFARLEKAEQDMSHIKVLNVKTPPATFAPADPNFGGALVTGNVVIAIDYFKMIMANLRIFFGGRLNSYTSLLERARREAILRMQREAEQLGADAVYNIRLEFSAIGQNAKRSSGAELLAYGTAVKFKTVD